MSLEVIKKLGLKVDIPYGKCYFIGNRSIPVVAIIKNIDFRFPSCPRISYKENITMCKDPPRMYLSNMNPLLKPLYEIELDMK